MCESVKASETKIFMPFNLVFANNTVLSCFFFFFFLNYWLIIFNSCTYYTNFMQISELGIPIRTSSKEAEAGIEIHPVTIETKIRKCSI